jgi:hypothetical protein
VKLQCSGLMNMNNLRKAFLASLAVVVTTGFLWFTSRSVAPRDATLKDVFAEARRGGYELISTEELRERYSKRPEALLLVDTRQEWEYRTGHIKSAVNFPMEPTSLSRWQKKDELETFLGADKNRFIVFY